jgi:hypothetical protein
MEYATRRRETQWRAIFNMDLFIRLCMVAVKDKNDENQQ